MKKTLIILGIIIMLLATIGGAVADDSVGAINEYRMDGKNLQRMDWDASPYTPGISGRVSSPAISFAFHAEGPMIHEGILYVATTGGMTRMNASDISQPIIDSYAGFTGSPDDDVSRPIVANGYIYQTGVVSSYERIYQFTLDNITAPLYQNTCSALNPRNDHYDIVVSNVSGTMYAYCQGPISGTSPVRIYQFDADNVGNLITSYAAGPSGSTSYENSRMAVTNNYLYIGESNGDTMLQLQSSNIANEITSLNVGNAVHERSGPVIANGYAYFSAYDGVLYMTPENDVSNVLYLFDTHTDSTRNVNTIAIDNGYVYVSVASSQLESDVAEVYQLHANNLSLVSQFTPTTSTDPGFGAPVVDAGIVYIHHSSGMVYELNANNLSEVYRNYTAISGNFEDHSVLVTDDYVYFWEDDFHLAQVERIAAPTPCVENWVYSLTPPTCTTGNQTITYTDSNACGTYSTLPGDNGTTINCTVAGSGGTNWPEPEEPEAPPLQVVPVPEQQQFLDFTGLFEEFQILFQKIFSADTVKEETVELNNYWLEIMLLVLGLALLILAATQTKNKKKPKRKRKR